MSQELDETDRRILRLLQQDASLSVDALSEQVNLSRNAVWRRIRRLEELGVIRARVALVDPAKVGKGLTVLAHVRAGRHDAEWMRRFDSTVRAIPEVVAAYRLSGNLDYLLKLRVADVAAYDTVYKQLVRAVPMADISASFVMEELKETTAVPL